MMTMPRCVARVTLFFFSSRSRHTRLQGDWSSSVCSSDLYAKAIPAAGGLEPAKVRDALAKVEFNSLYGKVKFGSNGQISLPQTVIQIQNGEVVEIFAEDFLGKPRYPLPPWAKRGSPLGRCATSQAGARSRRAPCNCSHRSSSTGSCSAGSTG